MNEQSKNSALFIAYHFPPSSAVGGQRIVNFARHLPDFGIEPVVLTIKEQHIERLDNLRLKEIEGVRVIRTGKLRGITNLYLLLKKLFAKGMKDIPAAAGAGAPVPSRSNSWNPDETFGERARRRMKSYLIVPDAERDWIIPAIIEARREIKKGGVNCIVTTCPPYSAHLVGLIIKRLTGIRWLADFRDPWMLHGTKKLYPTSGLSLKLEKRLEQEVLESADLLIFNTERMRDAYRKKYEHLQPEKFTYLPNGFEPEKFSRFRGIAKYERFTLVYTGSLYVGRTPEPVFAAVKKLIDNGSLDERNVSIKLVGECMDMNGRPTAEVAASYGLSSVVEVCAPVPYSAALEMAAKSHVALLFAPNLPLQIPAKIYDYLGVGARILALAEDGATADVIRSTGSGESFNASDVEGIAGFIRRSYNERGQEASRCGAQTNMDVKLITGKLAGYIIGNGDNESACDKT
ncbi:MAG: glycosyltransferase [Deltaproteobacteria bacterium]|nr:glycosyltransferase [Deltaproteobacteria bacterium]